MIEAEQSHTVLVRQDDPYCLQATIVCFSMVLRVHGGWDGTHRQGGGTATRLQLSVQEAAAGGAERGASRERWRR